MIVVSEGLSLSLVGFVWSTIAIAYALQSEYAPAQLPAKDKNLIFIPAARLMLLLLTATYSMLFTIANYGATAFARFIIVIRLMAVYMAWAIVIFAWRNDWMDDELIKHFHKPSPCGILLIAATASLLYLVLGIQQIAAGRLGEMSCCPHRRQGYRTLTAIRSEDVVSIDD